MDTVVSLREKASKLGVEKKSVPGGSLAPLGPMAPLPPGMACAHSLEGPEGRASVTRTQNPKSVKRGRPKLTESIWIETEDGEKKLVSPEEWRLLRRRITNRMSARRQKEKKGGSSPSATGSVRKQGNQAPTRRLSSQTQKSSLSKEGGPAETESSRRPLSRASRPPEGAPNDGKQPTLIRPTPIPAVWKPPVPAHMRAYDAQAASNSQSAFKPCTIATAASIFKDVPNLPLGLNQIFDVAMERGRKLSQTSAPLQPSSMHQGGFLGWAPPQHVHASSNPFQQTQYLQASLPISARVSQKPPNRQEPAFKHEKGQSDQETEGEDTDEASCEQS